MLSENQIVFMCSRNSRRRTPALKVDYLRVRDFILHVLFENKEITLTELIEKANNRLSNQISGDVGWLVLKVKLDLESRGFLTQLKPAASSVFPVIRLKMSRSRITAYCAENNL